MLPCPDRCVVRHVVMRCEEFDLCLAAVDHEDDVVDSDRSFGYVRR